MRERYGGPVVSEVCRPSWSDAMTGHPTVLIVDDNDLVRNLVVTLLKKSGFDVLSAASGQAAIDLVGRENPAIDCAHRQYLLFQLHQ